MRRRTEQRQSQFICWGLHGPAQVRNRLVSRDQYERLSGNLTYEAMMRVIEAAVADEFCGYLTPDEAHCVVCYVNLKPVCKVIVVGHDGRGGKPVGIPTFETILSPRMREKDVVSVRRHKTLITN